MLRVQAAEAQPVGGWQRHSNSTRGGAVIVIDGESQDQTSEEYNQAVQSKFANNSQLVATQEVLQAGHVELPSVSGSNRRRGVEEEHRSLILGNSQQLIQELSANQLPTQSMQAA